MNRNSKASVNCKEKQIMRVTRCDRSSLLSRLSWHFISWE